MEGQGWEVRDGVLGKVQVLHRTGRGGEGEGRGRVGVGRTDTTCHSSFSLLETKQRPSLFGLFSFVLFFFSLDSQ